MSAKKIPGRRFVYAVGRKTLVTGKWEYSPTNPYSPRGEGFEKAKIFSQRGGATSRANHRNHSTIDSPWVVVPCEVIPIVDANPLPVQEAPRYTLVKDNSGHNYIIPDVNRYEWDDFCAIPSDDPLSWDPPPFAHRVSGPVTFTDPRY